MTLPSTLQRAGWVRIRDPPEALALFFIHKHVFRSGAECNFAKQISLDLPSDVAERADWVQLSVQRSVHDPPPVSGSTRRFDREAPTTPRDDLRVIVRLLLLDRSVRELLAGYNALSSSPRPTRGPLTHPSWNWTPNAPPRSREHHSPARDAPMSTPSTTRSNGRYRGLKMTDSVNLSES